jgi:hypothetical protein
MLRAGLRLQLNLTAPGRIGSGETNSMSYRHLLVIVTISTFELFLKWAEPAEQRRSQVSTMVA